MYDVREFILFACMDEWDFRVRVHGIDVELS